jgi:hypothetical protein
VTNKRIAHLIGIGDYHESISSLPVTRRDCEALSEILPGSGYEVTKHLCGTSDLGRNGLEDLLIRICTEAPAGAQILLFFSGHGLHLEGADYLVPKDARYREAAGFISQLVPASLTGHIRNSKAAAITCILDACRSDFATGHKGLDDPGKSVGSGGEKPAKPGETTLITVYSCKAGEASRFEKADAGLSHFTRALCAVLAHTHPAETVEAVLAAAQDELDRLTAAAKHPKQTIHLRLEQVTAGLDAKTLRLCDGPKTPLRDARETSAWCRAARGFLEAPGLWPDPVPEPLLQQVETVVAACWLRFQRGRAALPQNRWDDEGLPGRVLTNLRRLIEGSSPRPAVNVAEAALLATAPFVHEAVWANAVVVVAETARPLGFDGTGHSEGARGALERLWQSQPQWVRKHGRLRESDRTEAAEDVACWLVAVLLSREPQVWRKAAEDGWLPADLLAELGPPPAAEPLARDTLSAERMLVMARCLHADWPTLQRRHAEGALPDTDHVGQSPELPLHQRRIAALLALAGGMALDLRRLSPVLTDHLGLSDPVTLPAVRAQVEKAVWRGDGQGFALATECDHPALDFALTEQARWLDTYRGAMVPDIERESALADLKGLPLRFGAGLVRIARQADGSSDAFSRPHLRFELAQDEVRELLMGEKLYGDPTLAIRELYQNALDACRYRRAREQYLTTLHPNWERPPYEGKIRFVQGEEDGRAFIECHDNGIGMALEHLKGCFATAGRRFADTSEFIEERARWLSAGIEMYPNSQFGIGVLSYFMLADEIEVETCRLGQNGGPGHRLLARISGSGSLFRVVDQGDGITSGTRVRLYLNNLAYGPKRISCLNTLTTLLVVAEFFTVAIDGNQQEEWHPGVPRGQEGIVFVPTGHPDLWWAIYPHTMIWGRFRNNNFYDYRFGYYLADGILTDYSNIHRNSRSLSTNLSGDHEYDRVLIINFTGEHQPDLSVDRTKIKTLKTDWIVPALMHEKAIAAAVGCAPLTLRWLSYVASTNAFIAESILDQLCQNNSDLLIHDDGKSCPARQIGCTKEDNKVYSLDKHYDAEKFDGLYDHRFKSYDILAYGRARYLSSLGINYNVLKRFRVLLSSPGYIPKFISPIDGCIFKMLTDNMPHNSLSKRKALHRQTIKTSEILKVSATLNVSLGEIVKRFSRFTDNCSNLPAIPASLDQYVAKVGQDNIIDFIYEDTWEILFLIFQNWTLDPFLIDTLPDLERIAPLCTSNFHSLTDNDANCLNRLRRDILKSCGHSLFLWPSSSRFSTSNKVGRVGFLLYMLAHVDAINQPSRFEDLFNLGFPGTMPNRALDRTDVIILSDDLDTLSPFQWPEFTCKHIGATSRRLNLSEAEIRERLQAFVPFGAIVHEKENFLSTIIKSIRFSFF